MLATPTPLPLASPAVGPKRSIGRPEGAARPYEPPQQQGNMVHQARPFLAHVQKDASQRQLGVRRLGSPPKDVLQRPLDRQTSTRRVGSPPKEALQRQTSTRRVGSPPPASTKSGSPTPAQGKRSNVVSQDEATTSHLRPAHQSPRSSALGTGARPVHQTSRAPTTGTSAATIGGGRPPGIAFSQPRGSASQLLYVPKGSSMEAEPAKEPVLPQLGANLVQNSAKQRDEIRPASKPSSIIVRPSYHQPAPGNALPARTFENEVQDVKPSVELVQSDTASTASQEHVQADTASNSSQDDTGTSLDHTKYDPTQSALVWTPLAGVDPEPTPATVLWTPRVGACRELVPSDMSKAGVNQEGASADASPAALVWTPNMGLCKQNLNSDATKPEGSLQTIGCKEHVIADTSKSEPSLQGASVDTSPASLVWTPCVGACGDHTNSDAKTSPKTGASADSSTVLLWAPRLGACNDQVDSGVFNSEPNAQVVASSANVTSEIATSTSQPILNVPASAERVDSVTLKTASVGTPRADASTTAASDQRQSRPQAGGNSDEFDAAAIKHVADSGAGPECNNADAAKGDANNASSGAASPRAPRCLARSPPQRVLRSRSPPSEKRGLEPMRGLTRMSQGSLEAFAAECQTVCQTYEKNLHELQLLCSAIDRTAQSPRGGTSRQSLGGTPDSSCRPSCRGTVRTLRTSGGSKSTTPDQSWRSLHESKKASTPERNWRMTAGRKDAGTPERNWRATVRKDASTPERSVRAPCLNQGRESSRGHRGTDTASQERTPRPSLVGKASTQSLSTRVASRTQVAQNISRTDSYIPDLGRPAKDESVVQSLLTRGFLTQAPAGWMNDPISVPDDLAHVRTMFSAQVPGATVLSVYRVKHDGHSLLFKAVQETMESKIECILWHGTSMDSVRNIALNGFNRNYCGRHGMKLGYGTYFSSSADYSVRFCDRRTAKRVMFLSKVLVGTWTKGSQEMKEPPFRDSEGIVRYDSTVDSVESPNIFCVFRDYQAVPLYLIEFSGPS